MLEASGKLTIDATHKVKPNASLLLIESIHSENRHVIPSKIKNRTLYLK